MIIIYIFDVLYIKGMDIVSKSVDAVFDGIQRVLNNRSLENALYGGGLFVQREAQRRVPVDTGALKASARTDKIPAEIPTVRVGFTKHYAAIQHENLAFNHTVGEAKYLLKAVLENRSALESIVGRKVKITLDTGKGVGIV